MERATAQTIHQTYAALLELLSLSPGHRNHLREKRGLTDEQIDRFGFKSTPPPYDRYLEQEDYKVMVGLLERFL